MMLNNNSCLLYNNSSFGVIAQQINVSIDGYIQQIVLHGRQMLSVIFD
jgi:hypothetical protein